MTKIQFEMRSFDTYATVYTGGPDNARPVATLTRPRLFYDRHGLWTSANTNGAPVKYWINQPSQAQVARALDTFDSIALPDDMTHALADSLIAKFSDQQADSIERATYCARGSFRRAVLLNLAAFAARRAELATAWENAAPLPPVEPEAAPVEPEAAPAPSYDIKAHDLPRGTYSRASGGFPLWAFNAARIDHMREFDCDSVWADLGPEFEFAGIGIAAPRGALS